MPNELTLECYNALKLSLEYIGCTDNRFGFHACHHCGFSKYENENKCIDKETRFAYKQVIKATTDLHEYTKQY